MFKYFRKIFVPRSEGPPLRTAPLPIHKVINAIFKDGMNGIYLYFVNKHRST